MIWNLIGTIGGKYDLVFDLQVGVYVALALYR